MYELECETCGKAHLAARWYVRQLLASKQIVAQYLCGEAYVTTRWGRPFMCAHCIRAGSANQQTMEQYLAAQLRAWRHGRWASPPSGSSDGAHWCSTWPSSFP